MKIQKELVKLSKDLEKMSKRIQKLSTSIPKLTGRVKKVRIQKSAPQYKGKKTGTQTVLDMIRKSKSGLNAQTLIKRTGFVDKKIRNILFKALTDGKIERVGRGVYNSSK